MKMQSFITPFVVSLFFFASPLAADQTQSCHPEQINNCNRFCSFHQGMQSCVLDLTKQTGTCTCVDGTSHSKSK